MLEKYRRLRYRLLPFISDRLLDDTYQTGSGFVRALIMDFPNDSKVADTRDEYIGCPGFPGRAGNGGRRNRPPGLPSR